MGEKARLRAEVIEAQEQRDAAIARAERAEAAYAALEATVAVWRRTRCGCPGPCPVCPPLADDHQADAEYRATRHLFENTTGPGRTPGRQ